MLESAGYEAFANPSLVAGKKSARTLKRKRPDIRKLDAYRSKQRELFHALSTNAETTNLGDSAVPNKKNRWLISDLVTLGSPLTYAEFLIARNQAALKLMSDFREILRCPPMLDDDEDESKTFRFSYKAEDPSEDGRELWKLHHASAMGPVRWTNIHDSAGPLAFLTGDIVSGPLATHFGPGVVDIKVDIQRTEGFFAAMHMPRFFTHTLYWSCPRHQRMNSEESDQVYALRDAINVLDDHEAESRLLRRWLAKVPPHASPFADASEHAPSVVHRSHHGG